MISYVLNFAKISFLMYKIKTVHFMIGYVLNFAKISFLMYYILPSFIWLQKPIFDNIYY